MTVELDDALADLGISTTPALLGLESAAGDVTINSLLETATMTGFKTNVIERTGDTFASPIAQFSHTGTGGTAFNTFSGSATPIGAVTGSAGDLYVQVNGTDTHLFQHRGASANNVDWVDITDAPGNVQTVDDLLAGQLLIGDGGDDIKTIPSITYNDVEFHITSQAGQSDIRLTGNAGSSGETVSLSMATLFELHFQNSAGTAIIDILAASDDNVSAGEYRFGRDSLSTGENRILLFEPNSTTLQTRLASSGEASVINAQGGNLGVGINAPISPLHLYEDSAAIDAAAGLTIEQDGLGDTLLHFVLSGAQRWVMGLDNSASDMLKFQAGDTLDATAQFVLDAGNGATGIGNAVPPDRCLHVQAATADDIPLLKFRTTGTDGATIELFFGTRNPEGLVSASPGDHYGRADDIDSGLFIHKGAVTGNTGWAETVTAVSALVAGQLLLGSGSAGITTEADLSYTGTRLDIAAGNGISLNGVDILTESGGQNALLNIGFIDVTTETTIENAIDTLANLSSIGTISGSITGPSGAWMDDGFNAGPGDMFSIDSVIVLDGDPIITLKNIAALDATTLTTIEDAITALNLQSGNASGSTNNQLKMSLDSGLEFTHAIKTRHNEFNQFSNAIDFYLWDADEDAVGDVGTMPVMTLRGDSRVGIMTTTPDAALDIISNFGDTTPVLHLTSSANAGTVRFRVGDRDPDGMVNGIGPDIYFRDDGALSAMYENRNPSSADTWLRHSVYPSNIIELNSSAEFDDLASGGVVTISEATTLVFKVPITTANRIEITGLGTFFHITANDGATSSLTYTGTGTLFTSAGGSLQIHARMQVISLSTGTLLDINGGPGVNLRESAFFGWDDLGTVANTGFFMSQSFMQNIGSGLTLTNNFISDVSVNNLAGTPLNGPWFVVNTNNPFSLYTFSRLGGLALGATGSIFDIDTRFNNNARIRVSGCTAPVGDLFKQSVLTDATINSVADGSPATGTITAMADNGSGGTTISSTTTYFEDEEVTITGTTSYNGTFQIFNVVAGVSFDTITAFVADDATGSVDSVRLTLSLATGHGISTGDSIKIIDTNFYNDFQTTLNVVSDDITVNGIFISTNTGSIERELSLDQTDPRVSADENNGFVDSHAIAASHVNNNATANGAIVNNTFTDMVFGTVGSALLADSTMERWRLVDEINGTFEYFGQEPFDGSITFDFTVASSGGTVDFRFKWEIDEGGGFGDLSDNVEALVAVGSAAQSITKTYPLAAVLGDRIKPQITRNSGTSTITATYVTMYVSQ